MNQVLIEHSYFNHTSSSHTNNTTDLKEERKATVSCISKNLVTLKYKKRHRIIPLMKAERNAPDRFVKLKINRKKLKKIKTNNSVLKRTCEQKGNKLEYLSNENEIKNEPVSEAIVENKDNNHLKIENEYENSPSVDNLSKEDIQEIIMGKNSNLEVKNEIKQPKAKLNTVNFKVKFKTKKRYKVDKLHVKHLKKRQDSPGKIVKKNSPDTKQKTKTVQEVENNLLFGDNLNIFGDLLDNENSGFNNSKILLDFQVNDENQSNKVQLFFNNLKTCLNFSSVGNLPIHEAVIKEDVKEVNNQSIVLHTRVKTVDIKNSEGFTALQLAIMHRVDPDIISILLKFNADVTIMDFEGNNAFHLAALSSEVEIVRRLLDSPNKIYIPRVDVVNFEGQTPLIISTLNNDYVIVEQLLLAGFSPNIRDRKSGRTALFHAVELNNEDGLIQILLYHGADTRIQTFNGYSAHDAIFEMNDGNMDVKDIFLSKKDKVYRKKRCKHNFL